MIITVDIDETILITERRQCTECGRPKYTNAKLILPEVELMKSFLDAGHYIILYTGRGWDQYKFTKIQLKALGVPYSDLQMGKLPFINVDTQNVKSLKELECLIQKNIKTHGKTGLATEAHT